MPIEVWIAIKLWLVNVFYRAICTVVHYTYVIFYRFRGRRVPPVEDPLLLMPATELAKLIREQKVTSETVVLSFIKRIKIVEPYINATVDCCFDEAIEEAKKADAFISSGIASKDQLESDSPLLGVPFSVKLLLRVKGLRFTAGLIILKDAVAQEDATVVQLMKKAGAIVLATTNTPEFGLNFHSTNLVHGATYNPHNTSRTSGASSGGESALIGAAGSVIGLGNDLGGSVRMPSLYTGIFGHKPSRGLLSNKGCIPLVSPKLERLVTTGPMCRYAQDLVTMMRILAPSNENTPRVGDRVNFQDIKVFYMFSFGEDIPFVQNVDTEIRDAVNKAVSYFQTQKKSNVQRITIPQLRESCMVFFHALISSAPPIEQVFAENGAKISNRTEFLKFLCFQSNLTFSTNLVWLLYNVPLFFSHKLVGHYKRIEDEIKLLLDNFLDENSILIMPTMPFTAPYPFDSTLYAGSCCYTGIFNVFGMPATHCPLGVSTEGLPLGIQIVGQRGNDHLTIAAALELEKAFGGWIRPS